MLGNVTRFSSNKYAKNVCLVPLGVKALMMIVVVVHKNELKITSLSDANENISTCVHTHLNLQKLNLENLVILVQVNR